MSIYKTLIITTSIIGLITLSTFAQKGNETHEVWKPFEINGRPIETTTAYIEIKNGEVRFTGSSGCNQMSGAVTMSGGGAIVIGPVITTKRACKLPKGSMPEGKFLDALDRSVRYKRSGHTLRLYDSHGKQVLKFNVSVKWDHRNDDTVGAGLAANKWYLESIGSRKTLIAIEGVFVNFDEEKGGAGGDTGCNVYGGSYTSSKNSIAITNIISTMRACVEDGKMQIEREFLDGLRNANRYDIKGGRLHLYRKNNLLLTLRGEPK